MTDAAPANPNLPAPVYSVLMTLAPDVMQAAAAFLVGHGVLSQANTANFITIGIGAMVWGASYAFSYVSHRAALNTPTG